MFPKKLSFPLNVRISNKKVRTEYKTIICFFFMFQGIYIPVKINIKIASNKIVFGALNILKIKIEAIEPIAAPARSEAYNLKLFSTYVLNILA